MTQLQRKTTIFPNLIADKLTLYINKQKKIKYCWKKMIKGVIPNSITIMNKNNFHKGKILSQLSLIRL